MLSMNFKPPSGSYVRSSGKVELGNEPYLNASQLIPPKHAQNNFNFYQHKIKKNNMVWHCQLEISRVNSKIEND